MTAPAAGCTATRHAPTLTGYSMFKCRCPETRAVTARYYKLRHCLGLQAVTRRAPAAPYRRRIQALHAIGHTLTDIAATHPRLNRHLIGSLGRGGRRWVYLATAAALDYAWTALRDQPGRSAETRRRAAAAGWWTPTDWDAWGGIDDPDEAPPDPDAVIDPVALHRVITGEQGIDTLTDAEQGVLYTTLHRQGLTDGQIRYRLDLSAGQLNRIARAAATHPVKEHTAA